ncbi:MAG: Gmad2 immunoglobulin-like domain-containing protein [Chloroflexota bacterium]
MKCSVLLLALALMMAACSSGASGEASPAPTTAPSATVASTQSPKASPVVSAKGFISITSPTVNAKLQSPVIITGEASVFEAALQWRITDTGGRIIAEGNTTASQGAPGRGTYTVTVPYTVTAETVAFVEVYSRSPKDGNIDDRVQIPVTLR